MNQLALPVTERRMESPEGLMQAALAWITENPEAWSAIVGAAQRDALDGGRVRVKLYAEYLRLRSDVSPATRRVKFPNALTPAFGRVLRAWHPEIPAKCIPLKPSKLDGVVIPPRSYQ